MCGEEDDMFPLWGVEYVRVKYAVMGRMEKNGSHGALRRDRRWKQATNRALWEKRGRHAGSPDSSSLPWRWDGSHALPIIAQLQPSREMQSSSFALEAFAPHTSSCYLSGCISEGNQNKMDLKQNMHTWRQSQPCVARREGWKQGSGKYTAVTASLAACWGENHHNISISSPLSLIWLCSLLIHTYFNTKKILSHHHQYAIFGKLSDRNIVSVEMGNCSLCRPE